MRYLGIDYGEKRVGIALSDQTKTFANPLVVLENNKDLVKKIIDICEENIVEAIVVGESKDYQGKDNKIMKDIKVFAKKLKDAVKKEVYMHPEFLTSKQAEHIQGKNDMHDASAASIILTSFLDTNKNKKK